jgi:hypothetical protein
VERLSSRPTARLAMYRWLHIDHLLVPVWVSCPRWTTMTAGDDQPQQAVKARNMIKNGTPDMEGGRDLAGTPSLDLRLGMAEPVQPSSSTNPLASPQPILSNSGAN